MKNADQVLLRRAVEGDRSAIARLLLSNYDAVYLHISRQLRSKYRTDLAVEDVLQETFIDACRGIRSFSSDSPLAFSAWLRVVADNRLKNSIRALNARKRGGKFRRCDVRPGNHSSIIDPIDAFCDADHDPADPLARKEIIQAVKMNLAILPEDQKRAIELRYLQGESISEAAAEMSITTAALRGLLHRAKATLRSALGRSSRWFYKK